MRHERRLPIDHQCLQFSTLVEFAGHIRNVAVKKRVVPVLGHVDNAGRLVHSSGLVFEPAHRPDGNRLDQPFRIGGDLEYVAVILTAVHDAAPAQISARGLETFLAGQPGTPGCRSAGAVHLCSRQAQVLSLSCSCFGIVDSRRCTACAGCLATTMVVHPVGHGFRQRVESVRKCAVSKMGRCQLVVADQDYLPVLTRKRGHAIVRTGNDKAIVHALAGSGHDGVTVVIRQIEDPVRIGAQWPYLRIGRSAGHGKCRHGHGNREVLEKAASIHAAFGKRVHE